MKREWAPFLSNFFSTRLRWHSRLPFFANGAKDGAPSVFFDASEIFAVLDHHSLVNSG